MKSYQDFLSSALGEFGLGQFILTVATLIPKVVSAWCMVGVGFFTYTPDWWRIRKFYNETSKEH